MTNDQNGRSGMGLVVILALGGLILIGLGMRSCIIDIPGMGFMNSHSMVSGFSWFGPLGLFGIGGLIQCCLAVWVGLDAERRGMNGWLWGLLVLFTFVVGLIVYLIAGQTMGSRPGGTTFARSAPPIVPTPSPAPTTPAPPTIEVTTDCPSCQASVQANYNLCPHCGKSLRCLHCNEALRGDWKLCPQCGTSIPGTAPADR